MNKNTFEGKINFKKVICPVCKQEKEENELVPASCKQKRNLCRECYSKQQSSYHIEKKEYEEPLLIEIKNEKNISKKKKEDVFGMNYVWDGQINVLLSEKEKIAFVTMARCKNLSPSEYATQIIKKFATDIINGEQL